MREVAPEFISAEFISIPKLGITAHIAAGDGPVKRGNEVTLLCGVSGTISYIYGPAETLYGVCKTCCERFKLVRQGVKVGSSGEAVPPSCGEPIPGLPAPPDGSVGGVVLAEKTDEEFPDDPDFIGATRELERIIGDPRIYEEIAKKNGLPSELLLKGLKERALIAKMGVGLAGHLMGQGAPPGKIREALHTIERWINKRYGL